MPDGPIHLTLADEAVVDFVRRKVQSGEYASEADVVREGISALRDDEAELEQWLKEIAGPRLDSFHANPSSGIPINQVEKNLEERRRLRAQTRS